jgi:hypothetical protein
MTTFSTVDAEGFREAMRPVVEAIGALTEAVDAVAPRFGRQPHVDAPAMRELSDEQDYARRSGMDAPITLTHSLGGLTLTAATDYVRSFAAPFTTERMPLYGHLVEARAALESATVCWWLNEPGVARDERVKRGLSEFIYSAVEVRQLKLHDKSKQHLKDWLGFAANLGWPVTDWDGKAWVRDSRGKPLVGGVGRPAPAAAIRGLLVDDETSKIGKLLWSRLSAVSHVTYFGLEHALETAAAEPDPLSGLFTVAIATSNHSVYQQAACILKGLRRAADARFELMGWQDELWKAAQLESVRQELGMLKAAGDQA